MLSKYRVYRYVRHDAPAVTAGSNAVLIGTQNGLFPDMGYTVPGEMAGLWAGEVKICDGFFFAVDDVPLTECDAYEAHPVASSFHYRMQAQDLHVVRRQYVPDGVPGCVIELTIENLRNRARMAEVSFTVRTEILTVAAYNGEYNLELGRDVGEYDENTQAFYARDSRNPWHAVWGADSDSRVLAADLPERVYGFGNTLGKGVNGRLFYRMRIGANSQASMRLFVAGGFASRSKAEDALLMLRERAQTMYAEKEARVGALMDASEAELPDARLSTCWNWSKIYSDWLYRELPLSGCGLRVDLPEHPFLFGEKWALGISGLLPMGEGKKAKEMLRTLVRLSEEAQLAPGRVARGVSMAGKVMQVGGVKDSAWFVALVYETLLWTGDVQFAHEMLPMTGLCVSYLRRSTRAFDDVRIDILEETRMALAAYAAILRMTGASDAAVLAELAKLPPKAETQLAENAVYADAALWHGERGHVEQMIGCLGAMAESSLPGLPGALRLRDAAKGVMIEPQAAAGFVWPMMTYLFGIRPDACKRRIVWRPHTPIGWDGWAIKRLAIGDTVFTVRSERVSPSKAKYTISADRAGWQIVLCQNGEEKTFDLADEISLVMED
ncbi:MAG: hypothetical protein IKB82_05105 [Clostridia bacterium]|nr:hypothetical protein [Clostridia bacterium]